MGLMFLVGYAIVVISTLIYLLKNKIKFLKNKEFTIPFVFGSMVAGLYYIAIAISQGDPYPKLLWGLGMILGVIFTGLGKDIYVYIRGGAAIRNYYNFLKGSQNKEEFKFEEKDLRKKIRENCPIFKKE